MREHPLFTLKNKNGVVRYATVCALYAITANACVPFRFAQIGRFLNFLFTAKKPRAFFDRMCYNKREVIRVFFFTKESVPEGVGFEAFGPLHIAWLAGGALFCVLMCVVYKRLGERGRNVMRRVLGSYIFLQEMAKNAVLIALGDFSPGYLPFHLCGINILLIAFDVIKPTKTVRSFLYYFSIPGAALALLFPNWTEMPFWNFFHFHSFIIHILLVAYPLLLVTTGQVEDDLKAALKGVLLLIGLAIPVYGLNVLWDTNFMFLMEPDSGNPLEFFEGLMGSHLWGFPILLPIVVLVMYIPLFAAKKLKK